jgi:hypothetical protein
MTSGDHCVACKAGHYEVYSSKRRGDSQVRFLRCYLCCHKPQQNKLVIPADEVRRRKRRRKIRNT